MSDLRAFHMPDEIQPGPAGKIIGALVIIIALAVAGIYSYKTGMWNIPPLPLVPVSDLPSQPPLSKAVLAVAPPPSAPAAQPRPDQ